MPYYIYLRNIKYLKNVSVILINLFDNFEENIIKWFGGYIFKFNDDYEYKYLFFNITNTDKKYNFYMKNIEKYKDEIPFEAWIRRISINNAIDDFRKNQRRKDRS